MLALLILHNIAIIRGRGEGRLPSEGVKNGFGFELFSAKLASSK